MSVASLSPSPPANPQPARLPFLDGVRGLAALYVALHHAALLIPPKGLSGFGLTLRFFLRHGHGAVAIFIVLSGYCLMLPEARDASGRASPNFGAFLLRRARRILPAYFTTLLGCWILIWAIPDLGRPMRSPWDRALPAFGPGVMISHVLLVHNLNGHWLFKIDPPMWSIATEWQIYLLFPIFVGLWRRNGLLAAVAGGFAIGYSVAALAVPLDNPALRELCPWFTGLFTLGMASALAAHHHPSTIGSGWRRGSPAAVGLGLVGLCAAGLAVTGSNDREFMLTDPIIGMVMAGLLVRWTRRTSPNANGPRPPLLRLFERPEVVALGTISYSLYLIHYPLLALGDAFLRRAEFGADARLGILIVGLTPAIVIIATVFQRVVERPFLTSSTASLSPGQPHQAIATLHSPGGEARPSRSRALERAR